MLARGREELNHPEAAAARVTKIGRRHEEGSVLGCAKVLFPGLVNFVPAVAYHFCLSLPASFSQPGNGNLGHPCISLK